MPLELQRHDIAGSKYSTGVSAELQLDLYILPGGEMSIEIRRPRGQLISAWRSGLMERGWLPGSTITHPFVMDTYLRDGRQVRLEHDSLNVLNILVFGLNTAWRK